MRRLLPAVLALSAAFGWAGAVVPAWQAALGLASGVRAPGAGDALVTGAARLAGSWGRAIGVPGLGALAAGAFSGVNSVSCASAGNCVAGGLYSDRRDHFQGFVVSQRHGRWGTVIEVPGLGALNLAFAEVTSVSCPSVGNCVAGGTYTGRRDREQGFVVSQRRGRWGTVTGVPGLEALNKGGGAGVTSVSCPSAGNCAAAGTYTDRRGHFQGFVASQRRGRWGTVIEVPGLGALNKVDAGVYSVSCASAGNCAAGGTYADRRGHPQGFVASQRHGRWGTAAGVPGLGALNKGGSAEVVSVSCASAGNCAAGGDYTVLTVGGEQGFVVAERDGRWGTAAGVPGLMALNMGFAEVGSVSCPSAGSCTLGGTYTDRDDQQQGFVVSERHGRWGTPAAVPGLGTLNKGGSAEILSVSCPSAGNCAAGGTYLDRRGHRLGFVVSERHGHWGTPAEMPQPGALNAGGSA
jgi:hypothetical protein